MSGSASLTASLRYGLTLGVAEMLPFENIRPVFRFGWFELTNLELLVAATAVAWAAHLLALATRGRLLASALFPLDAPLRRLILPAILFLLVAGISAILAQQHRLDALKFVGRLTAGLYALLLIAAVASTPRRIGLLVWAIIVGAGVSAAVGLAEALDPQALSALLAEFRPAASRVGGELRLGATFQYPTIAAMFLEMAVLLAVVLSGSAESQRARLLALAIAIASGWVVVLTLTRAAMATLAVVLGLMLVLALGVRRWRAAARPTAATLLSLLGVLGVLALVSPTFRLRMVTENDLEWYGAAYVVPRSLSLDSSEPVAVAVEVRNTGLATWKASGENSFALGYRWLNRDSGWSIDLPSGEVPLPHDVAPGETVRLTTELWSPLPSGDYLLSWGMLQRKRLWFRQRRVPESSTLVHIPPGTPGRAIAVHLPASLPADVETVRPPTVPRAELWRTAIRLGAEHPLLGIGPGNFRHLYGPYLGLADWDRTIHANNLYLELFADLGVLGVVAFGWLLVAAAGAIAGPLRSQGGGPITLWALGASGALLAFLIHGLLDYFLEFTSVYLLFWMMLGLVVALARGTRSDERMGLCSGMNRSGSVLSDVESGR